MNDPQLTDLKRARRRWSAELRANPSDPVAQGFRHRLGQRIAQLRSALRTPHSAIGR